MKGSLSSVVKMNGKRLRRRGSQFGCVMVGVSIVFLIGMAKEAKADCLSFNGMDSYVEVWDSPELSGGAGRSLTVEAWVFPTAFPTSHNHEPIISKYKDWNTKDWGLMLDKDGLIGFQRETWASGACHLGNWFTWSSETIPANQWSHIAFVVDNDNDAVNVYINGILKGSNPYECDLPDSTAFVWLGGRGPYYWAHGNPGIFSGYIDEVRIWEVARTGNEILDNMLPGNITGSEEGLAAYWDFEKGLDPNVLYDCSDNLNDGRIVGATWSAGGAPSEPDDTTPPSIEISLDEDHLWPPNGEMVDVGFSLNIEDDFDSEPDVSISVTSDEPTATAPGPHGSLCAPDAAFTSQGDVFLRSERSPKGDGRVYQITVIATDASGNISSSSASVKVNHHRRKEAIDSGQDYDAAQIN